MTKIYLDTSDLSEIRALKDKVQGFTTNPTLMRKAGVTDYEKFCKEVLAEVGDKPVSFEVFADEFSEMQRQAKIISSWGSNVYVKVPVTNTQGKSTMGVLSNLLEWGVKVNLTAITRKFWMPEIIKTQLIISIFAGRIADTGVDPKRYFMQVKPPNVETLWASPREVLNIYQAEQAGADIITVTPELFRKYEKMKGYDLDQLSLDTVRMFYDDAVASGFKL